MKKSFKILFNIAVIIIIVCFIWYIWFITIQATRNIENSKVKSHTDEPFASPYKQVSFFELPEEINCFDLFESILFIAAGNSVNIYNLSGQLLSFFPIKEKARDITTENEEIYILYPTSIEVYTFHGELIRDWEACSQLSDYCSFTVAGDYLFVTDAENKNICKYTKEGGFIKFIQSPSGFIIPSYTFDIDCWNDTVYCVNSGSHLIETYTVNGDFITSFGKSGSESGFFAGCCNPAHISFTPQGKLITSEKGNPRVSLYDRKGNFNGVMLDNKMLGLGNKAREAKVFDNKLFVAIENKIIIFKCDQMTTSECSGCIFDCPHKK